MKGGSEIHKEKVSTKGGSGIETLKRDGESRGNEEKEQIDRW